MHPTVTIKINNTEFKVSPDSICQMEDEEGAIDVVFLRNEDYLNIYKKLEIHELEKDGEEIVLNGTFEGRELVLANWEEEVFCDQCQATTVHNPVMSKKATAWACESCGIEVSL